MVRLNGKEYAYRPEMSLKELVDGHNADICKLLAFDGVVILVNDIALTAKQVQERILSDNDKVIIVPMMDGG